MTLRAELVGSGTATAPGIAVHGHAPVTRLCRRLVAAGHDLATPLEVFRGAMLCLRVRSISEGAKLTVKDGPAGRPRFVRLAQEAQETYAAAPPMRERRAA
jgi:hypothetical protein